MKIIFKNGHEEEISYEMGKLLSDNLLKGCNNFQCFSDENDKIFLIVNILEIACVENKISNEEKGNGVLTDVMLSLPTVKEIEAWAKEQSKIEPTGAEEFGRLWGAIWMRGMIEQKLKGNGA